MPWIDPTIFYSSLRNCMCHDRYWNCSRLLPFFTDSWLLSLPFFFAYRVIVTIDSFYLLKVKSLCSKQTMLPTWKAAKLCKWQDLSHWSSKCIIPPPPTRKKIASTLRKYDSLYKPPVAILEDVRRIVLAKTLRPLCSRCWQHWARKYERRAVLASDRVVPFNLGSWAGRKVILCRIWVMEDRHDMTWHTTWKALNRPKSH